MKEEVKKIVEFESGVRIVEVTEAMFEDHMEQAKHDWVSSKELRVILVYGTNGRFLGAFTVGNNSYFIPKTTED